MNELPIDEEHVLHFAMRYALGRRSAAPSIVVGQIAAKWSRIRADTKEQMKREIREAINEVRAGETCDECTWGDVLRLP